MRLPELHRLDTIFASRNCQEQNESRERINRVAGYNSLQMEVNVERRHFLTASIAASAFSISREGTSETARADARQYYQIRRYLLRRGPELELTESYLSSAMIPALSRMHMGPIGAFTLDIGPDTPSCYLLIPSSSLEDLVNLDFLLTRDPEFMKSAAPFWNATANAPAFQRVEVSLSRAFPGWPKLTPPPSSTAGARRIFQLRTYESPGYAEHIRKVEMFHRGAFQVFKNIGFHPVFFGDVLSGTQTPCLTYMLAFSGMQELESGWERFFNDSGWKKLSTEPRYAFDQIVTNITNLVTKPLPFSQI